MGNRIQLMEDMNRLHHDILTMGTKIEENLRKALLALRNGDVDLARDVKADDAVVDALQLKIDDQVAVLIATQAPVARDLRELVTVFKVTDNLERVGDHAVHLAKLTIKLSKTGEPAFRQTSHLETMAEIGCEMIRGGVQSYLNHDVVEARRIAALDDGIDHEHKALVNDVLGLMREHPEQIERASRLITTSGFLERLGDHMTNLCEAVVFMEEGRHIELND